MNRIMLLYVLVITFAGQNFALPPDSTTQSGVLVKGNGYEFELVTPKGWVMDLSAGASSGMDAQLYPTNSTFSTSPTVMYVTSLSRKSPGNESVKKLVSMDKDKVKKGFPNVQISRGEPYETKDHKKAVTTIYGSAQFQATAYVEEDSTITMFVLKSNLKNRFDNAKYSLKDLIGSYRWVMKKPK